MIRLTAMIPGPNDATSHYRGMGPLIALEKARRDEFEVTLGAEQSNYYDWQNLGRTDIFFAQRPCTNVHQTAISNAKEYGVPVWVDMDDNLFGVESDNIAHSQYSSPQAKMSLTHCLQMADVVTVTTEELRRVVMEYCPDVRVIPNAHDDKLFGANPERSPKRSKVISWRGGGSHMANLAEFTPAILSVAERRPDWKWAFIGFNPWSITEKMAKDQFRVFDFMTVTKYMGTMQKIAPAVHMVPLRDTRFNRCRSNIAWLEACYAGARTIAPGWEQWQQPDVVNYNNPEEMIAALCGLTHPKVELTHASAGWEAIKSELLLSKVNEMRWDIIKSLVR